jgi:hypothetical protein
VNKLPPKEISLDLPVLSLYRLVGGAPIKLQGKLREPQKIGEKIGGAKKSAGKSGEPQKNWEKIGGAPNTFSGKFGEPHIGPGGLSRNRLTTLLSRLISNKPR